MQRSEQQAAGEQRREPRAGAGSRGSSGTSGVSSSMLGARLPRPGMRSRSTRRPAIVSSAGSRVSAAIIVNSTASAAAIATP